MGTDSNDKPPNEDVVAENGPPPNGAGVAGARGPSVPNIETNSSRGFIEVPERRLAAAGIWDRTCVAASPDGCPSIFVESSKSLRKKRPSVQR